MAYQTLNQMTANMLDPVRGWWDERQLSRVCPVSADADKIVAGMVGYLNTDNQFVAGGGVGSKNKMPLFARGGAFDNDAIRIEGNMASQRASNTQGTPARVGPNNSMLSDVGISCLVGTGAYELGTTAYVNGIVAGDMLMADASAGFDPAVGAAGKGKIAKFAASTTSLYAGQAASNNNQVVGIATSDAGTSSFVKNQYGVKMLYFYVNWWPAI
jgi:hypothetical protein